jgi:hypothetical protein
VRGNGFGGVRGTPRPHWNDLTQCIYQSVLGHQLPQTIINSLFPITNQNLSSPPCQNSSTVYPPPKFHAPLFISLYIPCTFIHPSTHSTHLIHPVIHPRPPSPQNSRQPQPPPPSLSGPGPGWARLHVAVGCGLQLPRAIARGAVDTLHLDGLIVAPRLPYLATAPLPRLPFLTPLNYGSSLHSA